MRELQIRRVVGALGLDVEAIPLSFPVLDRDGTPFSHGLQQ